MNHDLHKGNIGPQGLHVWPVRFTGKDWAPTHEDMGLPGKDFVIDHGQITYEPTDDGGPLSGPLSEAERLAIVQGTGARFPWVSLSTETRAPRIHGGSR